MSVDRPWRDAFDEDFAEMLLEYVDKPVTTKLVQEIVDKTFQLLKSDKYRHCERVQYLRRYWSVDEMKKHFPNNSERRKLYSLE
jgi:hypothetical protein